MTKSHFFVIDAGPNWHWSLGLGSLLGHWAFVIGHSALLALCLVGSSSSLAATGTVRARDGLNLQGDIGIVYVPYVARPIRGQVR